MAATWITASGQGMAEAIIGVGRAMSIHYTKPSTESINILYNASECGREGFFFFFFFLHMVPRQMGEHAPSIPPIHVISDEQQHARSQHTLQPCMVRRSGDCKISNSLDTCDVQRVG